MAHTKKRARSAARPDASSVAPRAAIAALAPLGALAAGFGLAGAALAQTPTAEEPKQGGALPVITVRGTSETESKETYRAKRSGIGKGDQALRDIPQSVTVVTERLMDDRNLDDFREVLRTTAGVTFQAGETGEEDVRLRGFSLFQAGDIYVDGLRDPALQERDTFNHDRVEVLKGSASMLFGRGSTGGVVNQVSKQPFLMTQHEVEATVGSGDEYRVTGDFNVKTGDDAALRINAMYHDADKWGARVSKKGIAPTYRFGIGTRNEFSVGLYHLQYDNRPLYNHPWVLDEDGTLQETLPAKNFYGLDSDYNKGEATYGTFSHLLRMGDAGELKTTLRHGRYKRNLWASVIRGVGIPAGNTSTDPYENPDQVLSRTAKGRVGETDVTYLGTVYTNDVNWFGLKHDLIAGVEWMHEDAKRNNNIAGTGMRPTTTVGTPHDGATFADPRDDIPMDEFDARTISVYGQDTVELTQQLKLLAGLRYDHFKYRNDAVNGRTPGTYDRTDVLWSHRLGLIYQPNDWSSYHVSYGTSFNTSGDTYSLSPANEGIKPEESRNFEVGSKFDLFENRMSVGAALFYTEKHRERNTDPDSSLVLLSGKRHAAGLDIDLAGRITPQWEAFVSYTWIPSAKIDKSTVVLNAAGTGAQVEGDRPGLSPKHMAALWTTYRIIPALRVGAGVNYRGKQNPEGARHVTGSSFTTLDLMAEYTFSENLSLKFNVNNATDELYADSLYRGFYSPGAPRTYQMTLKATF